MPETRKRTKVTQTSNTNNTNFNNQEGEIEMAKKNETTASEPITIRLNENGVSKMKLSDVTPIAITMDEFKSKSPQELSELVSDRLSQERAKAELITRIREERIKISNPEVLADWTYKNVSIEGVTDNIRGVKKPVVTLTLDQFKALMPEQKADYILRHTHKRRIAESIFPELIRKGMPLSAENIVNLTCGRVSIEGLTMIKQGKKQRAIVTGIEFA